MNLVTAAALSTGKRGMLVTTLPKSLCLCMAFETLAGDFLAEIQPTHQAMGTVALFTILLFYRLMNHPGEKFIGKLGMTIKTLLFTALACRLTARATRQHGR